MVQALRKKETHDETQFTREKLVWVPIICFCKIVLDALLWRNGPFSPHNHLTLEITLISAKHM